MASPYHHGTFSFDLFCAISRSRTARGRGTQAELCNSRISSLRDARSVAVRVGGGARTDEGAKEEAEREEGRPSIS